MTHQYKIYFIFLLKLLIINCFSTSKIEAQNKQISKKTKSISVNNGEAYFKNNCIMCHNTNEKDLVGPGLKDITKKRSFDWIYEFTKQPFKLIIKNDTAAVSIYEKYNKIAMPAYLTLTKKQLTEIIEYINFTNSPNK